MTEAPVGEGAGVGRRRGSGRLGGRLKLLRRSLDRLRRRALRRRDSLGLWPFRAICGPGLRLLAWRYGEHPVPLPAITLLRRLAAGPDPLARDARPRPSSDLADDALRRLLAGRELGVWSLGPAGIAALGRSWRAQRPELAIEFGSGVSTLCLAHLARQTPGLAPSLVLAIEQDAQHARETRSWLETAGLAAYAHVVHAPIAPQAWDGVTRSTYQLPPELAGLIGERRAGLVLVDGPAAERAARVATLPLVHQWLADGARVLLDDALRDGELEVARRWQATGWIDVHGILLVDKGLLEADVRSR